MGRFHNTQDGKVPFTPEEEIARDAEEADFVAKQPLRKWENEIAEMDKEMPRFMEDHIKYDHDGVASNSFQQAKYDAKKSLRSQKP